MNHTQIKHARQRLLEIRDGLFNQIGGHYSDGITSEVYDDLYERGLATIVKMNTGYSIKWDFDFDQLKENHKKKVNKINEEYNKALDVLLLGDDADDILKILNDFRNLKVTDE